MPPQSAQNPGLSLPLRRQKQGDPAQAGFKKATQLWRNMRVSAPY
jgi:hypothetical protein